MLLGSPLTARPSRRIFLALCRATASSISRKVLSASANENSPVAITRSNPDPAHILRLRLILHHPFQLTLESAVPPLAVYPAKQLILKPRQSPTLSTSK